MLGPWLAEGAAKESASPGTLSTLLRPYSSMSLMFNIFRLTECQQHM